ncbi:hypothetical protein D021_0951A, partial [Vibrio parahaemolyticus 10296]
MNRIVPGANTCANSQRFTAGIEKLV